jgi:type II secretory pathway component GspD/PulD (secretin)
MQICVHPCFAQERRPSRDPIVIQVIRLDYADAEHLASILAPFLSKEGRIVAYSPTNSLIIRDRKSLVKKLIKIIKGDFNP